MRNGFRILIALSLLVIVSIAQAQPVTDVPFDEDVLANLTDSQSAAAYSLSLEQPAEVAVNVRYLGAIFPFALEVFDTDGQTLDEQQVTGPGDLTLALPAGEHTLLLSVEPGNSGRAILRFSLDTDGSADGQLGSGLWQVTYGTPENTCPDVLSLEEALLPADGSTHALTFSDPPEPLEFHQAVAPDQIRDAPEFFNTQTLADNVFEVIPGIQTAPYEYTYTVNSPESITLDYVQTLALSDCVLTLTVEFTYTGPADEEDVPDADPAQRHGSVEGWTILGDAIEASPPDGDFLCGAPTSPDAFWMFDAPQSFVDQVVNGYGETLAFELRRRDAVQTPVTVSVTLVVGNAIVLSYELPTPVTDTFSLHEIPLTETAGWVDIDGMFDTSDQAMFQQLLSDVTRVQIPGNIPDADGFCLQNAMVGDGAPAATDTVPMYVVSQVDDSGIPVGCEGYMIALESGVPFADDPAENIRASLEPLLAMTSTDVGRDDYVNYLGGQGLSLGAVTVDDAGHATISLQGDFLLIGTCVDPQIEAQLLLGVFADERIVSARINANGENIKPFFDMSGQTGPDEDFTRDDIRRRTW
jgi:hypothetical protein